MYIPFNELRTDARIWIFQSDRVLSDKEVEVLDDTLKEFTTSWEAHSQPLDSSYLIKNKVHIIVGVDESVHQPTGCSIDTLMHLMQGIGKQLNVNFFDRKAVAYVKDEDVHVANFSEFKKLADTGVIKPSTHVFNNLVASKDLLDTDWKIPASHSWLKRFFREAPTT